MKLEFVKSIKDNRGRIFFCKYGDLSLNIVETKRDFSRGGHYHDFPSTHFLLKGKIIFKTFDLGNHQEQTHQYSAPCKIKVESVIAHLLTALTDAILIEFFNSEYTAINFPLYRNIIKNQI